MSFPLRGYLASGVASLNAKLLAGLMMLSSIPIGSQVREGDKTLDRLNEPTRKAFAMSLIMTAAGRSLLERRYAARDVAFSAYIVLSVVDEHGYLGMAALALFALLVFPDFFRKKGAVSFYFVIEVFFVVFCLFQLFTGVPVYSAEALSMTVTFVINVAYGFVLYCYVVATGDVDDVLRRYIAALAVGLILLACINMSTLFTARGFPGVQIGSKSIGSIAAVNVGWMAGFGFCLCVATYFGKENVKMLAYLALFAFFIIVSATRKALVLIPLSLIVAVFLRDRSIFEGAIKYIVPSVVAIAVAYYALMNIPALYDAIGARLSRAVSFLSGSGVGDASTQTRARLIERAQTGFSERPVFGWGLDNFRYAVNHAGSSYYAHNNFWEILADCGVVGFSVFYAKYLFLSIMLIRNAWAANLRMRFLIRFLFAVLLAFGVLEWFQVTYIYRPLMTPLLLILGTTGIAENARPREKSAPSLIVRRK